MKSWLSVLGVLAVLCAQPVAAQISTGESLEFNTFLRAAALVGKPASVLSPIWGSGQTGMSSTHMVHLTAAHNLTASVGAGIGARDTTPVVRRMWYTEETSDTLTLKLRVVSIESKLQGLAGRANRCTTPFGIPEYLFVPQTVTRVWDRGLNGHSTQLQWTVTPDKRYLVTVSVGQFSDDGSATASCQAALP
jgi:hypothetical protein